MSEICWQWDSNISSDINIQSSSMWIDSSESQIPDMQAGKPASEEDDRLTASLQTEEDQILQKKREVKINKLNKSLINYQAIQSILKAEMQTEKNKNIQQVIF